MVEMILAGLGGILALLWLWGEHSENKTNRRIVEALEAYLRGEKDGKRKN